MKLYIKGLALSGLLAASAACTDLDTDLNTKYPTFPDNPIATEGEFNGCYGYMHGWFGRDFNEAVIAQGDEVMGCCYGAGNYFDDGRYLNSSIHSIHLDDWRCRIIEGCMSGCTYTNTKIAQYGGAEFKDPIVAPLRAIRAYYHFWMMDLYGDAPIFDHVLQDGEAIDRSPRAEVAAFIESELLDILGQEGGLSKANDASTYGKPNYWMAAALLAKLYLNWGVYTNDITTVTGDTPNPKLDDCVKWCDEIINSGLFEVGIGYRKKFFPDNGVHIKDFIYALDVDPATKPDGTTTWYRWFGFKKDGLCRPYFLGWENTKSIAGQTVLTPEAVARFNLPNDERNEMILKGPQYTFDAQYNRTDIPVYIYNVPGNEKTLLGQLNYRVYFDFDDASIYSLGDEALPKPSKQTVADGSALRNIQKGARCFKYPPREEDYTLWSRQQANDAPIFRFADILLMKAECILRGAAATLGQTPQSLFNEIRRCSGAPELTKNPTMQELLDERSREFILEPWRRNDLIRFGQFEADWGEKNRYKVWDGEEYSDRYLCAVCGSIVEKSEVVKEENVNGKTVVVYTCPKCEATGASNFSKTRPFHWVERPGVKDPTRRLMPIHRGILETNLNWSQNPGYQGL